MGRQAVKQQTTGTTVGTTSTTAGPELPAGYEGYTGEVYADDAHWLCKPGLKNNPCNPGLGTTVFSPAGKRLHVTKPTPARPPRFDCFYVSGTEKNSKSCDPADHDPGGVYRGRFEELDSEALRPTGRSVDFAMRIYSPRCGF